MGAASSTGSPPGLCRGEPAPWWTALGKAVAARLEFPYRHKLLVLVCAYACVAAIFLCSFMAPSRSATERIGDELPDPDHLADPCTAQDPSQRHLNVQELREERRAPSLARSLRRPARFAPFALPRAPRPAARAATRAAAR